MDRNKQIIIRHWIESIDKYEKDAALAKLIEYLIENELMQIDCEKESPYWLFGDYEVLI